MQPVLNAGNNPWPIGVTSVGIHERSAREKISHVMNGAAHIMNDEATRKYLQAMKRVLTFVQRVHPTDPSRSVDFDAFRDAGRGAAGMGSDKLVRPACMSSRCKQLPNPPPPPPPFWASSFDALWRASGGGADMGSDERLRLACLCPYEFFLPPLPPPLPPHTPGTLLLHC